MKENKNQDYVKYMEIFHDGDIDQLEALIIEKGEEIAEILDFKNRNLSTPLHIVCKSGHLNMAKILIPLYRQYKIDIDQLNRRRDTPLSLVCSHGFNDIKLTQSLTDKSQIRDFQIQI